MAEDEYDDEDFEDEYEDDSFENEDEVDPDFDGADFGADDDDFGADDDGGGWGDDDIDINADQQYIPIEKPDEDSDEFELDKHGNIVSPRDIKRQKSVDIQCWTCSNCKAINKLSWTLTKFQMKCCMCKQDTYAPTAKIFDSTQWEEPSNDFWECTRCTLHNAIGSNDCEACQHPNEDYKQESDDDTNGGGLFVKDADSEEDTAPQQEHHPHHQHMHQQHNMHDMFSSMMGMSGITGIGGVRGFSQRGRGRMHGGAPVSPPRRRKVVKDSKPVDKRKEKNLRNLLIVGYIRNCKAPLLPTKFFDFFNLYYTIFDRWNWDFFRDSWTSKKNDIMTIKRGKKHEAVWKNMYGLKHIKYKETDKYPRKFEWKLRLLDRKQMEAMKSEEEIQDDDSKEKKEEKKESFELQYIDVMIGVVNVDKMPNNQGLSKAFSMYSCGYGLFTGNGKIYNGATKEWIRVCRALQHNDCVTVNIEWMERKEFNALYPSDTKQSTNNSKINENELVVALTFCKNDENKVMPKGAALCLPSSVAYKLAISSAKKRWEIEWISSNWVNMLDDDDENKKMDVDDDDDDDNKQN